MINVTVLDLSTAIVPRTVIETKESNGYALITSLQKAKEALAGKTGTIIKK